MIVLPRQLVDAYSSQRMTLCDVAAQVGRAPSTVYNALKKEGVDTSSRRKRKSGRNVEVVAAVRSMKNLQRVAEKFELTRERVRQIVAAAILADVAVGVPISSIEVKYGYTRQRIEKILVKS